MTCRSPSAPAPPSTGASRGTGYGPGSLSSAYSNETGTRFWVPPTTTYGMPNGPPSQSAPKSGCRWSARPIDAMSVAERGSSGALSTRVFHGFDAGNGRRPRRLAFAPSAGFGVAAGAAAAGPAVAATRAGGVPVSAPDVVAAG